ncbi:MAG: VTT domain-containing protein [Spirochaetales bacterium]
MDFSFVELFLHLDQTLRAFFEAYGWLAYAVVFLILFLETGAVVLAFLPGDSLVFACGALAATLGLDYWLFYVLIGAAAILGNLSNYAIGRFAGAKLLTPRSGRKPLVAPEVVQQTHAFFDKWGGWAVAAGRFLPFLRTLVPFVAGLSLMTFARFSLFSALGGLAWTTVFLTAGYFFGNLPFVKDNFSLIVVGIVLVTGLPAVIKLLWPQKTKVETQP